jgi:hypothetical protein
MIYAVLGAWRYFTAMNNGFDMDRKPQKQLATENAIQLLIPINR